MIAGRSTVAAERLDSFVDPPQPETTPWLLALLCLLIGSWPTYAVLLGPLKSHGSPVRMIGVILFGLTVLGFLLVRRTSRDLTVRPGVILIVLYFLLMLLVFGVTLTHLDSAVVEADKIRAAIIFLAYVGVALYATTRIKTSRQRSILLGCLLIGLTANCLIGLLQIALSQDIRFVPPGFTFNVGDESRGLAAGLHQRFGADRAYGLASHAIEYSVLAAVTVPLCLHFVRYATSRQNRVLAGLACIIALVALPAGIARTGVLALGAALLIYVWNLKLRSIATGLAVGALAVVIELICFPDAINALWQTFISSANDRSVSDRISAYASVSQAFRAHPLFGMGLGGSPPSEFGFVDNEWLQTLVQGGLVGLAAMTVLAVGGLFGISAALRAATTARERDQAYTMGSVFAGVLVSSFTFDLFSHQQAAMLFFLMFGLLWSAFSVSALGGVTTGLVSNRVAYG